MNIYRELFEAWRAFQGDLALADPCGLLGTGLFVGATLASGAWAAVMHRRDRWVADWIGEMAGRINDLDDRSGLQASATADHADRLDAIGATACEALAMARQADRSALAATELAGQAVGRSIEAIERTCVLEEEACEGKGGGVPWHVRAAREN